MRKTWPIKLWHIRRDMKDVDDALDDLGTNLLELHNKGLFVGAEANEILNRLIDLHTWINEILFIPNTIDTDDGKVRWNLDHRVNLAAENDGWDRVEAA